MLNVKQEAFALERKISDLTEKIAGFEALLAALKHGAGKDPLFKVRCEVVVPQIEIWLTENTALLASYKKLGHA
jgi:hypothetical protein